MKALIITITLITCISGRANKKYELVQSKIVSVQAKIDNVNAKIDEVTILVDSLGFQLIK